MSTDSKNASTMTDFDAIVIGSGAGGLAAAVALQQAGKRTIVLEQHYHPGGWCHSFDLGGYRFSPGVHYIGECQPGGRLRQVYEGLGVSKDLELLELDPNGFDKVVVGKERFDIPRGKDAWKQQLMGVGFTALWLVVLKMSTFAMIILGVNILIAFILGRRIYRLRPSSPAVQALLTAPERIASVTGFPANVPAHQVPVFLDVRTQDGHVCTLIQEPKNKQPTIDLVSALHQRSQRASRYC
jgi:hypothetical protein